MGIIVDGDAAATAANIIAKGLRFRIGFVCDLLSALLFLLTAWALYALLKPVNRTLALLFLLLNLCGVAMQCFSMILLYAALPLLGGGGYLAAFTTDQLNAAGHVLPRSVQSGIHERPALLRRLDLAVGVFGIQVWHPP